MQTTARVRRKTAHRQPAASWARHHSTENSDMSFVRINAVTRASLNLLRRRTLHQSSSSLNGTPDWNELVGGRAGIERQRQRYESKYSDLIEKKAKERGLTVEEYKQLKIEQQAQADKAAKAATVKHNSAPAGSPSPVEAGSEQQGRAGQEPASQPKVVRPPPSAQTQPRPSPPPSNKDSPVKVRGGPSNLQPDRG